jgi:hypothetical protein
MDRYRRPIPALRKPQLAASFKRNVASWPKAADIASQPDVRCWGHNERRWPPSRAKILGPRRRDVNDKAVLQDRVHAQARPGTRVGYYEWQDKCTMVVGSAKAAFRLSRIAAGVAFAVPTRYQVVVS